MNTSNMRTCLDMLRGDVASASAASMLRLLADAALDYLENIIESIENVEKLGKNIQNAEWLPDNDGDLFCSSCGNVAAMNAEGKYATPDPHCRMCGKPMENGRRNW